MYSSYCAPAVKSHLRLRSSQQGSLFRLGSLFRCKGSFRERGRAGVRYSRGNRLGHVAPTGADGGAPSGRSGKRGAAPQAWLMKDPAWAWKVLKHLLRDLRKPSWIVDDSECESLWIHTPLVKRQST